MFELSLKIIEKFCKRWQAEIDAEYARAAAAGESIPNIGEEFVHAVGCLEKTLEIAKALKAENDEWIEDWAAAQPGPSVLEVTRDYLTDGVYGAGFSPSDLDEAALADAEKVCVEPSPVVRGTPQRAIVVELTPQIGDVDDMLHGFQVYRDELAEAKRRWGRLKDVMSGCIEPEYGLDPIDPIWDNFRKEINERVGGAFDWEDEWSEGVLLLMERIEREMPVTHGNESPQEKTCDSCGLTFDAPITCVRCRSAKENDD